MAALIAWVGVSVGGPAPTSGSPVDAGGDAAPVIASYRARIPDLMAQQDIPGLAVALVDKDEVLWTEGFGHLDRDGSAPVTVDTIFSVQSMSKTFTATAVMQAVQAGLLDLDAPITAYLPDFTVHSAFEEHPERKITLRMLLSHTAGFSHEAPVGNNYERDPGTFDEHVLSISDTWLRFPVGSGYAYSNMGIDLAGFILERTYGAPFATVMDDLLLEPLGMDRSTFDRAGIRSATDRAVGHVSPAPDLPVDVPMTAAGGLYSSAADLARFLRFQLNDGSIDGRTVLEPMRMQEIRTIPAPHAGAAAGYALGVVRYRWRVSDNAELFSHGGGGYGFLADLWWSPPLQVGIAVLTNSADHQLHGDLALSILGDLVHAPGSVFHDRLLALPVQDPVDDPDGGFLAPDGLAGLVSDAGMPQQGDTAARWAAYARAYRAANFGVLDPASPPDRFFVRAGIPTFDAYERGSLVRLRLTEVEAGLFLAENGETLDLRGPVPTWRNLDLVRITGGPAPWQWAILAASAVVAVWWLGAAPVSAARRRLRRSPRDGDAAATRTGRWVLVVAGTLTAVFVLGTVVLLATMPGLVDSGFLGWLEFATAVRLVLHLPIALTLATACLVVVMAAGRVGGRRTRGVPPRDVALVVASVVLTVQLAAWHLIGWGLT
jgi:CubicO group peptidase (beta-lactamase class C family)